MNRNVVLLIGGSVIVVLVVIAFVQSLSPHTDISPVLFPTESEPVTTEFNTPASLNVDSVSVTPASSPIQTSFALEKGDSINSWDFKGAYTGNPELVIKAQNEIARLSSLLSTATSSKMILYVGIANQYELLGDGKNQYEYLGRAIQANALDGLPWHNLGVLMERLGALQTARVSFQKATLVQPQLAAYHYAYLEFLVEDMKSDTVDIEKAFAAAKKNIGATQYLIDLRTEWKNS